MDRHDVIAQVACELYVRRGKVEGRDLDNWLEAEQIVRNNSAYPEDYWVDLLAEHVG
ncbi:MAG TPA: DUF2934 domain-containing protein [Thermodesulfovibrionales bacterium]|nr:DUF2934 domain-containing protein [Thermodesulfovibrionales bacterium]